MILSTTSRREFGHRTRDALDNCAWPDVGRNPGRRSHRSWSIEPADVPEHYVPEEPPTSGTVNVNRQIVRSLQADIDVSAVPDSTIAE